MFKLSVISFILLLGQVCSFSLIHQLDEQGEFAEAANNSLNDSGDFNKTTNFQDDILIPKQTLMMRNGLKFEGYRWPNATVPYEIRGRFNAREKKVIYYAFKQFHRYTCIQFVPRTKELDYISIVSGNIGCMSYVGRKSGKQEVYLQSPSCLTVPGIPIHELMHVVGFAHEQNRVDRDEFVSIQYQNLDPKTHIYFDIYNNTDALGVPYDYGSVLHYSATAFSINGKPTIIAKKYIGKIEMGQRKGFSASDIEKINRMYKCEKKV